MDELVLFTGVSNTSGKKWYMLQKSEIIDGMVLKLSTWLFENQFNKLKDSGITVVERAK